MLARSCAAAVAVGGNATERFIKRRGEGGVACGAASAGSGVVIGLAAVGASASEVGSGVADGVTLVGGAEGGCEARAVASVGVGAADAGVAPPVEVGTGVEAAFGVVSATGAASAGRDGVVIAAAAGAVAAGVLSDAGEGDARTGDAAGAGETDPGERVTRLSWM